VKLPIFTRTLSNKGTESVVPVSIKEVHPFSTNKWLEENPRCGHKRHQLWSRLPEESNGGKG
ncbi:uncharacterized protein METZ01_LOCUS184814, partial [marine metagenome]